MTLDSNKTAAGLAPGVNRHTDRDLLRIITCGAEDGGKSTLIGRLLFESKPLLDDPLAAVEADSRHGGTHGGAVERGQGITIDGDYRYFNTDRRRFLVADTPGHEQYTRNVVTGASTADLALILVDARQGVLRQTRRHSHLVALIGTRKVVLVVNKMDLVDYDAATFEGIVATYREFAAQIGLPELTAIPLSGLRGDNLIGPSPNMPWYAGPTLLQHLESVDIADTWDADAPLRLPVQSVSRPDLEFGGFSGQLASGRLRPGDRVRVQPSGRESRIGRIITPDGDRSEAVAGDSVTVTLADDIDVSRGDMISAADAPAEVADQFESTVVWMADEPMLPGRPYLLKIGTRTVGATITALKYRVNVETSEHLAATKFERNEIGVCNLSLDRPIAFDPYARNRHTGGFILIDGLTNHTVGAGMLHFALRRAHNIHLQHVDVNKAARAAQLGQKPVVLWFTGLSGSGKSTIANLVERKLHASGRHSYLLDGDNVRHGLNRDLGFTEADRVENIRRIAEVAKLMADAGLIVLTAFISPFRAERRMARGLLPEGEFIEIHVDTPLDVAEQRDVKGLYKKARRGELKNFTGIDSPYEAPQAPELRIDTVSCTAEASADLVVDFLRERQLIPR